MAAYPQHRFYKIIKKMYDESSLKIINDTSFQVMEVKLDLGKCIEPSPGDFRPPENLASPLYIFNPVLNCVNT